MRIVLTLLIGLVVVVAGLAFGLPHVMPQDWLRAKLATAVEDATGATVAIDGDLRWQIVPRLAAQIDDVRLIALPPGSPVERLTVGRLDAELGLFDLLAGEVVIRRFVVAGLDARIDLDRVAEAEIAPPASEAAAAAPADRPPGPAPAAETPGLMLDEVRLEDARIVVVVDRRERRIDALDGQLAWPDTTGPLALALDGRLDDRPLQLRIELASPRAFAAGRPSAGRLVVRADGLDATFDGEATAGTTPAAAGDLALNLERPVATLQWLLGEPIALPFQRLAASMRLDATADRVDLDDLDLTVDEATATGNLRLALDGPRPLLAGDLRVGPLDTAWFEAAEAADAAPPPPTGERPAADAAPATPAPAVEPGPAPALPLDLDLAVEIAELRAYRLRVGPGELRLEGTDGGLDADIARLEAYGGVVAGRIGYRPDGSALQLRTALTGSGLDLAGLLGALDVDEVTAGSADFRLDLETTGNDVDQWIAADGSGAIRGRGIRLQRLDRKLELRALRDLLALGTGGTDVTVGSLAATFRLTAGVLRNDDLVAETAALRLRGAGSVDLPAARVPRYVLTPEPLLDLERLGPLQHLQTVLVPVVIDGPFDDLRVRADPDAVASGPLGEAQRLLERLLRGDADGTASPAETLEQGVRDILRGFGIRP